MDDILHEIGDVLALALLVPLLLFIVFYRAKSPYRKTELGIAVMIQKIAIGLLILDLVLANYLPPGFSTAFLFIRIILFSLVLFLLVADFINLRRIQVGKGAPLIFRSLRRK